jgi:sugar phosphate isomerase/epimerase
VLLDTFHCHASGLTAEDLALIPPGTPLFVHLNDAPPLPVGLLADTQRLLPGQGVIDLKGLLRGLTGRGYDGPVSIELKNPGLHALPLEQAARRAFDAGQAVFRAAGLVDGARAHPAGGTEK